ncbi:MAG: aldehyde dehydrogenase family protein, partial [Pseudomonadota bacterium]
MASSTLRVVSPVDGSTYVERELASGQQIENALAKAARAQKAWQGTPLDQRAAICSAAVDAFVAQSETHVDELAWQMGRPVRFGKGEVGGFTERSRYMIDIASQALAPI